MGKTVDQMAQTQRVEADQIVRILREWHWVSDGSITKNGERAGLYTTNGGTVLRLPSLAEHRIIKAIRTPSKYRATDGHLLDSRAEWMIDEWLNRNGIPHEADVPLPFLVHARPARCDFYLPEQNVYIEFWGLDTPEYLERKAYKIRQYEALGLRRIDLGDRDLFDLDKSMGAQCLVGSSLRPTR